ncbi:MAG: plasmid mobilization relaxosome protein MobC [Candidatus Saccharimonadales bacterium]|mgnify:CR=1 FL=1
MNSPEYVKAYWKDYRNRVKRVYITLELEQFDALEARAKAEGLKPTTYATRVVEADLSGSGLVPSAIQEDLKAVTFLIRTIANNINQMAHYSNLVKGLVNEKELLGELRKLEKTVQDYTLSCLKEKPTSDDH